MVEKILVCDDQEMVREVVGNFLTGKGYKVTKASDGDECLSLIKGEHFDALFLDIKMPRLDGLSVMREVERLGRKIQIILMSGFDPRSFEVSPSEPTTGFLSKPFELDSVLKALKMKEKSTVNRVLIVDDQDMLREMLKDFLSDQGFEIVEACNGKEGIEHAKSTQFDAIFMDVRMPEMDGLAALEKLREEGIDTPVFIMSGYGEVASAEDAMKRGAQNFLPKPFKLEEALELLNKKGDS